MQNDFKLNIFLASLAAVLGLVTLLTLLPSQYYFTFSRVVAKDNQSQFFVYKDLATPTTYCRIKYAEVKWDYAKMEPTLADACKKIENFAYPLRSVFPADATIEGERLVSDSYRAAMTGLLDELEKSSGFLESTLGGRGFVLRDSFRGKSPGQIESILIADQQISLHAVLSFLLKDEEINYFVLGQEIALAFPELNEKFEVALAALFTEYDGGFRNSQRWANLADVYVAATYSQELEFLNEQIHGVPTDNIFVAFLIKLLPPLAGGLLIAAIMQPASITEIAVGAAAAAFLLCWPVILLWSVVVASEFRDQWPTMWALYAAYILAYFYFAKLGAQLGLRLRTSGLSATTLKLVEWNKVAGTVLTSLVTSIVVAAITWTFASAG